MFFVRHNGGSVWLNELGWPWEKHGCFEGKVQTSDYRFFESLRARFCEVEFKPKLGRIVKRIYLVAPLYYNHLYLIETHEGRIFSLAAKESERIVFKDWVAIHYDDTKIFMEDSRAILVRVRQHRLRESELRRFLAIPGEVVGKPMGQQVVLSPDSMVWDIRQQRFVARD